MATNKHPPAPVIAVVILFTLLVSPPSSSSSSEAIYESIISFGDSLADTGNLIRLNQSGDLPESGKPPYGETFFHHPTGRSCDGRLVIDFLAEMLDLPYLKPYLGGDTKNDFRTGVNFAVGGGMALGLENGSLGIQFEWFERFFAQLSDGKEYLQRSLVVVGEIGGNDYNSKITIGSRLENVKPLVPQVVNLIGSTIEELINKYGAETILVPNIVTLGCLPFLLNKFKTQSNKNYDPETGCIIWLNDLAAYHNELLLDKVKQLRHLYPDINIIHADWYNAAARIYHSPDQFGFLKENILKACCGAGGVYNNEVACGHKGAKVCDDPSSYASWDGVHFTEAFYKSVARGLFEGPYTDPQLKIRCSSFSKDGDRVYEY